MGVDLVSETSLKLEEVSTLKSREKKVILIRGTGTVGHEFIKRLVRAVRYCDHPYFKWDEIIFSKQSPLVKNVPKMRNLFRDAGTAVNLNMCVDEQKVNRFKEIGLNPAYTTEQALRKADVVFDVTPAGGENKTLYEIFSYNKEKVFVAEGSEFNKKRKFGSIFIGGVNEGAVLRQLREGNQFFVVGSCNAHTISRNVEILLKSFSYYVPPEKKMMIFATLCRRSDDPNKEKVNTAFSFSSFNDEYRNEGSYHAYNVLEAFKSVSDQVVNLKTVVAKLADPFMHCVFWKVVLPKISIIPEKLFLDAVTNDIFCAATHYQQANEVFMESREDSDSELSPWLSKSRSYSHSIICLPTVGSCEANGELILEYGSFTPQDSNTIWSNLEMASMAKNPYEFDKNEFLEITAPLFEPKEI